LETPRRRAAPQDEDLFLGALLGLFDARPVFLDTVFFVEVLLAATVAFLAVLGRFLSAARCAAARAALAHPLNSSGSSNSRAGNCQYEFTVTVLALVWY